jgi:hypothetical protein
MTTIETGGGGGSSSMWAGRHSTGGGGDVDIPPILTTQQMNQDQDTSSNLNQGPLTRSRAQKLQQHVTSLLDEFDNNITENIILPKSSTLLIVW